MSVDDLLRYWNASTGRYDWSGLSVDEIQRVYDEASRRGVSETARSARQALYRRGVRVGASKPSGEFGAAATAHVLRVIESAEQTRIQTGIQSSDGSDPKRAADAMAMQDATGQVPRLVDVAAAMEYGTEMHGGNVPERSYLRSTADRLGAMWARALGRVITTYGTGDAREAATMLIALGIQMRDAVQATIRARIEPELAEATKTPARVGSGGAEPIPLDYTGQLIGSIRSEADTVDGRRDLGGYAR